jgi:hypothetical protein
LRRRSLDAVHVLLLAGASLLAPSGPGAAMTREGKMEATMDAELAALDRHPELAVTVRAGTEHFRDGRIAVTVQGDGAAAVEQLRSGQLTTHHAQLAAARVKEVGATLARHRFTLPRTSKLPREPGDTPLYLSVARGGQLVFEAKLWFADRYDDRDLDAILKLYEALTYEVSDGKLGQPPPKR